MIIATQYPIREVVTPVVKRNVISRICFAMDSGTAYRVVLDEVPAYQLMGKGDGIYKFEGIQGFHRFQGALVAETEEESDDIINKAVIKKNQRSNINLENFKDDHTEEKEDEELTSLKVLIAQTGETRIKELQKQLKIRMNRLQGHMRQLVIEGWLKAPDEKTNRYELFLTEEKKNKYLNSGYIS